MRKLVPITQIAHVLPIFAHKSQIANKDKTDKIAKMINQDRLAMHKDKKEILIAGIVDKMKNGISVFHFSLDF